MFGDAGEGAAPPPDPRFRNACRTAVIQMTFDEPSGTWSIALSWGNESVNVI
jgi:hypothetical protein